MYTKTLIDFTLRDMQSHWKLLGRGIITGIGFRNIILCRKMNGSEREKKKEKQFRGSLTYID